MGWVNHHIQTHDGLKAWIGSWNALLLIRVHGRGKWISVNDGPGRDSRGDERVLHARSRAPRIEKSNGRRQCAVERFIDNQATGICAHFAGERTVDPPSLEAR